MSNPPHSGDDAARERDEAARAAGPQTSSTDASEAAGSQTAGSPGSQTAGSEAAGSGAPGSGAPAGDSDADAGVDSPTLQQGVPAATPSSPADVEATGETAAQIPAQGGEILQPGASAHPGEPAAGSPQAAVPPQGAPGQADAQAQTWGAPAADQPAAQAQ
ncbi:hypothetical protein ACFQ34_25175, partial [Pseudonocardia benzenivorans]